MKSQWTNYLLYGSLVIAGIGFLYLLIETVRLKNTGFETKTLWDWMELLVIPLVLAIGAYFLNRSERETERDIAKDRQQERALQDYIDRMSDLLVENKLKTSKYKSVRNVARTRTLTILRGLDSFRKASVIEFLYEAGLIKKYQPVIYLAGADLSNVYLNSAKLHEINLSGAILTKGNLFGTEFENADLVNAFLVDVDLGLARLESANLSDTYLMDADLSHSILNNASLRNADLAGANLSYASLIGVDLTGAKLCADEFDKEIIGDNNVKPANLFSADLSDANLRGASVTKEQLATAKSLKGATMPDGTIHE